MFAHFFNFSRYCPKFTTGKSFGHVHKYSQPKCPYPSPNLTFVVPPLSQFTSQHDSTNDYGVTVISHKQPSTVSNLTTKTQVITYSNNDDNTQYMVIPSKHNPINPKITETTTTTTPVYTTIHSHICQMRSSK